MPEPTDDTMVTVTIDGTDEQITYGDMKAAHQKATVSDKRFRDAAEKDAKAEEKLKTAVAAIDLRTSLIEGFAEQDAEKIKIAFRGAGLSEEQIGQVFPAQAGEAGDTNATLGAQTTSELGSEAATGDADEMMLNLLEEVKALTAKVDAQDAKEAKTAQTTKKQRILSEVDTAVDNDPELAKLLSGLDPEDQRELRELAYKHVATASKTMPWGPKAIQEGLKVLKARRKAWGAPGTPEDGDEIPGATGMPGFGPAGHSVSHLHPTTETKPVGMHDPSYAANIAIRMKELMGKWGRKRA